MEHSTTQQTLTPQQQAIQNAERIAAASAITKIVEKLDGTVDIDWENHIIKMDVKECFKPWLMRGLEKVIHAFPNAFDI